MEKTSNQWLPKRQSSGPITWDLYDIHSGTSVFEGIYIYIIYKSRRHKR